MKKIRTLWAISALLCPLLMFAQDIRSLKMRVQELDVEIAGHQNLLDSWTEIDHQRSVEQKPWNWSEAEWKNYISEPRIQINLERGIINRLQSERNAKANTIKNREQAEAQIRSQQQKTAQSRLAKEKKIVKTQQELERKAVRDRELEERRKAERAAREKRRQEEEQAWRIKRQNDYNKEYQRTSSYYSNKKSQAQWMASNDALDEMHNSLAQSRITISIEDNKIHRPDNQELGTSSANQLKQRLNKRSLSENRQSSETSAFLENNAWVLSSDSFGQEDIINRVKAYWSKIDWRDEPSYDYPYLYSEWIANQFKIASGYDITHIMNKVDWTDGEKQALIDFNIYATILLDAKQVEINSELKTIDQSPEKQVADMAILAAVPYGSNDNYLEYTNYKLVTPQIASNDVKDLAKMIELCNDDTYGFHAQLFYNDITNEYTVSFEGSSAPDLMALWEGYKKYLSINMDIVGLHSLADVLKDKKNSDAFNDWIMTNANQALYGVPAQFKLVASIAEMVNRIPDTKVNLTGHSLGGGLAGFCGLMTGRKTTTFNSEGVNWNIIWEGGEEARERALIGDNITAYHDRKDELTMIQKHLPIAKALGKEVVVDLGSGHSIEPMVEHFISIDSDNIHRWKELSRINQKYKDLYNDVAAIAVLANNAD